MNNKQEKPILNSLDKLAKIKLLNFNKGSEPKICIGVDSTELAEIFTAKILNGTFVDLHALQCPIIAAIQDFVQNVVKPLQEEVAKQKKKNDRFEFLMTQIKQLS